MPRNEDITPRLCVLSHPRPWRVSVLLQSSELLEKEHGHAVWFEAITHPINATLEKGVHVSDDSWGCVDDEVIRYQINN